MDNIDGGNWGVTIIWLVAIHPYPSLMLTVYVWDADKPETKGLAVFISDNPSEGDHE